MDTATASLENKPLKATVRPPGDAFPGLVYAQHAAVTKKERKQKIITNKRFQTWIMYHSLRH